MYPLRPCWLDLVFPALAQDGSRTDKTVAVVNGHEIKVSEVHMATDDIIGQLPDLPPKPALSPLSSSISSNATSSPSSR